MNAFSKQRSEWMNDRHDEYVHFERTANSGRFFLNRMPCLSYMELQWPQRIPLAGCSISYGLFRLRKKVRLLRLRSIVMNNHRLEFYHTLVIKVHASAMDNEKNDRTFCKNLRCHHVFFLRKMTEIYDRSAKLYSCMASLQCHLLLALRWLFIGMDSQKPRFQITAWVTGYI